MRPARIVVLGAAVCALILGVRWLSRPDPTPARVQVRRLPDQGGPALASDLPRPVRRGEIVPDASLFSQDGREFRLRELRGSVLVLAFLYTHCEVASLCPLTTTRLAQAYRLVQSRRTEGVRFLLVSFDPERDTPERLREYASRWNLAAPNFVLATGEPEEVRRLGLAVNTYYRESLPGVFDHSTVISVLDRNNALRETLFGTAWTPDQLIAAIEEAGAHPLRGTELR